MDFPSILGTIVSGLGGGALRLAPEIITFFDKKNEREHELALQDKQLEFAKIQHQGKLEEIKAESDSQAQVANAQAVIEAIKGQAQLVGNKFVDGLNMLVRPITTYYILFLWGLKKTAEIFIAMQMNGALDALVKTWTDSDQAMLSGILTFWFVSRTLEKQK